MVQYEIHSKISDEIRCFVQMTLHYAKLIKEELLENQTQEMIELFDKIELTGKKLIKILDLTLNISKISSGTYESLWKMVDLNEETLKNIFTKCSSAELKKIGLILSGGVVDLKSGSNK